jgi:metal-responsive CopG/Arc/MetJ family transcriptional regulator
MHRINLTIDEQLYEQARAFSFLEKKSISKIIRESLSEYLSKNQAKKEKTKLLLEAEDEQEVLKILKEDK